MPIIALNLPPAKLSPAMAAYFKKCQDKLGFVPNVLRAYAFDMAKLETFVAMYNDLMLGDCGLSKLEREMIAVAVSSQNRCYYCLTAHGAAVRQYSGSPLLGEHMMMNYRVARFNQAPARHARLRGQAHGAPWANEEENDRERLRRAGFTDRDIWEFPRLPASSICRTAWRRRPTCGRTRSITARRDSYPLSSSAWRGDMRGMRRATRFIISFTALLAAVILGSPRSRRSDGRRAFRRRRRSWRTTAWSWRRSSAPRASALEYSSRGGNAVDAAVAVGFALAVTYPRAGNIGGGGFMVIHLAKRRHAICAIDYRETAPAAATPTMFLDAKGNPDPAKVARFSGLAVGVPGTVAGLALADQNYGSGKLTLAELIAPAIKLAQRWRDLAGDDLANSLPRRAARLGALAVSRGIFVKRRAGARSLVRPAVQLDLAATLGPIARSAGRQAFYQGPIAGKRSPRPCARPAAS